jgi:ribose transport system substrate-binding protein
MFALPKRPAKPKKPRSKRLRTLVAATALIGLALTGCKASAGAAQSQEALKKEDVLLVTTLITSTNDYMQNWKQGSQAFADSVGVPLKVIVANGDSQQQLSQLQAAIATGKKVVLSTNPVASADVPAMVKAVVDSGGYVVTQWNKPDDFKPETFGPHYVAHLGYDGYAAGEYTARKLFESMGGSGGVVAIQGVLDSTANRQRYAGFEKALKDFPNIKVLGTDNANWDRQTAFQKMQSLQAKFGDQIKGVWTGGDSMTQGALSAMEQAGKGAKVKVAGIDGVKETLDKISGGDAYVSSWYTDGYYSGALGLAMGYAAATGDLDVSKMTADQRNGTYRQVGIDKSNVAQYINPPTDPQIMAEVNKGLFDRLTGPALTEK